VGAVIAEDRLLFPSLPSLPSPSHLPPLPPPPPPPRRVPSPFLLPFTHGPVSPPSYSSSLSLPIHPSSKMPLTQTLFSAAEESPSPTRLRFPLLRRIHRPPQCRESSAGSLSSVCHRPRKRAVHLRERDREEGLFVDDQPGSVAGRCR